MVDFLKLARQRTLLSEIMYYALNIGLALALLVLALTIQSPMVALALVLISKWRVLAVRLRYWWTNIQANAVDTIVGVSTVLLMYSPGISIAVQAGLAAAYAAWLVLLKPQSKKHYMLIQSLTAIALGVTTLYSISYEWPVSLVVIGMGIIGYSAARHFLYSYEEDQIALLSGIYGLIFAEIGWLAYYWTFAYTLPFVASIKIPQVTIIVLLVSFMSERIYLSWSKHKQVVIGEVIMPVVFSVLIIGFMVLFFNSVTI